MIRTWFCRAPLVALAFLLCPATTWAQSGEIAGVVRDTTGAVLPGVTVEAASPALIEKFARRSPTTNVEPPLQTQVKLLGLCPLPWNLVVSATFQRVPGPQIGASYVVRNADIAPSLRTIRTVRRG
jgi:hypothetical protein